MELTIRGSEEKESRLTETEPQTISVDEEFVEDENQDNEASEFGVDVPFQYSSSNITSGWRSLLVSS